MTDEISKRAHLPREQQRSISAGAGRGMNVLKPIMQFQVSMLRCWRTASKGSLANTRRALKKALTPSRNSYGSLFHLSAADNAPPLPRCSQGLRQGVSRPAITGEAFSRLTRAAVSKRGLA